MNILTFDVEEWFHILDNESTKSEKQWDNFEVRIYKNMERIFNILEKSNSKATFFIIGWIAKKYPDLVREIAKKYQIGSHTMNHQLVWQQSPNEFKQDVESSIKLLEDITGHKVEAFRAPGFSIRETEAWAFESLYDLGVKYDCSVFPAHHSHGGMPSIKVAEPCWINYNGIYMKEFPITYKQIFSKHIIYSGGGYFRLCPYKFIHKWTKQSHKYTMAYIHPRDLDCSQPMISGLNMLRRFKSYYGIGKSEKKLRKYLSDFKFTDISTANNSIDWENAPIYSL